MVASVYFLSYTERTMLDRTREKSLHLIRSIEDAKSLEGKEVGVSDWVRALQEASPALKASDRVEYGDIREEEWQRFYAENSPIKSAPVSLSSRSVPDT